MPVPENNASLVVGARVRLYSGSETGTIEQLRGWNHIAIVRWDTGRTGSWPLYALQRIADDRPSVTAQFTGQTLRGWRGDAREIRASNGERYVASSVVAAYSGPETLVFRMGDDGDKPESWTEVAGGRGFTLNEALADLILALNSDPA